MTKKITVTLTQDLYDEIKTEACEKSMTLSSYLKSLISKTKEN
ncbi:hypothetical protein [Metamycoplasma alkalescens]|nr:hypothetical protein [Metamycoplasma alkalescens]